LRIARGAAGGGRRVAGPAEAGVSRDATGKTAAATTAADRPPKADAPSAFDQSL
jgi:hypothetical protein